MKTLAASIALLAFGGCGKEPPPAPPPPPPVLQLPPHAIQDAPGAIRSFERFWNEQLVPALRDRKLQSAQYLTYKVPAHLHASRSRFEDIRREIEGSLTADERSYLILHGTPETLPREGACWSIQSAGGYASELRACLDPESGAVLLVWVSPEG